MVTITFKSHTVYGENLASIIFGKSTKISKNLILANFKLGDWVHGSKYVEWQEPALKYSDIFPCVHMVCMDMHVGINLGENFNLVNFLQFARMPK